MRKLLFGLLALGLTSSAALADGVPNSATVVSACGTPPSTYTSGQNRPLTQNTSGQTCTTNAAAGTTSVNVSQINGNTVNTGTGASSTGTQRVAVASDSVIASITNAVAVTGNGVNAALTPTVQNAAYASGNCMGGFNAFGSTGSILNNVGVRSIGGGTTALTLYLFLGNPSTSTCTDKSTFTIATADLDKIPPGGVIQLTPASVTGTTITFASFTGLGIAVPSGTAVYEAIVSGGTWTPATTTDLHVSINGPQ